MPSTPRRKQHIIRTLAKQINFVQPVKRKSSADKDLERGVINFYLRDDNSIWTPGVRDYVNVMENGQQVKMQRRYLKMTLMELYELFITENELVRVNFVI